MKPTNVVKLGGNVTRSSLAPSNSPSRASSGINPLDQAMESFKEGVFTSTEDYIEGISRKIVFQQQHIQNTKLSVESHLVEDDHNIFDSSPYEEVFENTLSQLTVLRSHVDRKISILSKDCSILEKEYKSKLGEIQRRFDKVFKDFKSFDSTINKVSTSAQRIGGSLESVEQQRNRAIETQIFLNYLVLLNDDQARLHRIFGDTTDVENAILLKNLNILAAELDMQSTMTAKQNIEKMSESLEISQLEKFIKASQENKYKLMKECAKTLFELNGGEECIKSYINALPMFFQEDIDEDDEDSISSSFEDIEQTQGQISAPSSSSSYMSSQNTTPPGSDKFKQQTQQQTQQQQLPFNPLFPRARLDIVHGDPEANFIRVDRFYEKVLLSLQEEFKVIQKVFPIPSLVLMRLTQRVFEQRISTFIDLLLDRCKSNLETYLTTMAYCLEKINVVLKELAAPPTLIPMPALLGFSDDVFVKHRDDFIKYQVEAIKEVLIREQEVEEDTPQALQLKAAGKKVPFKPISLDIDLTIRCLECAEDAANRCALLSHPKQLAENMYRVFQTLIREFGRNLMLVALEQHTKKLDVAISQGFSSNTATANAMNHVSAFFELVQTINTNVVLLQKHYFVKIRPHVEGSRNEQTLCQSEKNKLLQLLEERVEDGLDKSLTIQMAHIEGILAREQRSRNWKPKPNELDTVDLQHASPACLSVCAFIKIQFALIGNALDGRNLQAFLIEFATRTLQIILKHIRKYQVEHGIGAFCFMRDMSEYQECIATFNISKLNHEYEILKSIAKLHLVNPEQLPDVIADSSLAKMNKSELDSYVKMRSDYDKMWLGKYY